MVFSHDVPVIRTRAIERPRLLEALGSQDRPPLTLIHGPAGSGKSTLMAQWAHTMTSESEAILWISLREDDFGRVPFWNRVGDSLALNSLIDRTDAGSLGRVGADGDRRRAKIFDTIGRRHPLTLVLDDYHHVTDATLDAELGMLAQQARTLRLMVGTRTLGGLHSVSLGAQITTTLIDVSQLAFTRDESDELVESSGLRSGDVTRTIFESAHGWPLASQALIVETLRDADKRLPTVGVSVTRSQFVEEFVAATLARRTTVEADFLRRVSLADELSVELASLLSGDSQSLTRKRLTALEADGTGTWQVRSGVPWFRVHPLLREGFEAEAISALTPEVVVRLRGLLSDRLRSERPLRALELAIAIEDWDRVEMIALMEYGPLTYYYRLPSSRLLVGLPASALHSRPALFGVYFATLYGIPTTSLAELTRVGGNLSIAARKSTSTYPGALGVLQLTAIASSHRLVGEDGVALAYAERAVGELDQLPQATKQSVARSLPTVYTQLATVFLVEGEYLTALSLLASASEITSELRLNGERFHAAALTALVHAVRGDITSAAKWIAMCDESGQYDGWFVGYLDSGYYMAQAVIALNRWDAQGALEALTTPGTREHLIEFWPYLAIIDARARLWTNGALDAHAELSATMARKRLRPDPPAPLRALLTAVRMELLIIAGQPTRAEAEGAAVERADDPGVTLAEARLAALRGEHTRALASVDRVMWSTEESPRLRVEALLLTASISVDIGDLDRAVDNFVAATTAIDRYGIRLPLAATPRDRLGRLLSLAHDRGHRIDASALESMPHIQRRSRSVEALSKAEQRVLRALTTLEVEEAAEKLHLSAHTVRYHLKRSYRKLGVNSKDDALRIALELGLLDIEATENPTSYTKPRAERVK